MEKRSVFSCVGKEKERVGFDFVHLTAKGIVWMSTITQNLLVLAV